jgi:hypothetical protein
MFFSFSVPGCNKGCESEQVPNVSHKGLPCQRERGRVKANIVHSHRRFLALYRVRRLNLHRIIASHVGFSIMIIFRAGSRICRFHASVQSTPGGPHSSGSDQQNPRHKIERENHHQSKTPRNQIQGLAFFPHCATLRAGERAIIRVQSDSRPRGHDTRSQINSDHVRKHSYYRQRT